MTNKTTAEERFIEPIPLKKGDRRILINGIPIQADCRIIAEESYQDLIKCRDRLNAIAKEVEGRIRDIQDDKLVVGSILSKANARQAAVSQLKSVLEIINKHTE